MGLQMFANKFFNGQAFNQFIFVGLRLGFMLSPATRVLDAPTNAAYAG